MSQSQTLNTFQPDRHQQQVIDSVRDSLCNICVSATAGSGKTTTILECLKHIPRFKKTIFLSFSSGIVKELKSRVPIGIEASTLHSLGFRTLLKRNKTLSLEEDKYFRKAIRLVKGEKSKEKFVECYQIQDICNFIRLTLTNHTLSDVTLMCHHYNLEYSEDIIYRSIDLIEKDSLSNGKIDYTDMIYLPVKLKLVPQEYDYVFIDEVQDTNQCQLKFVEGLLKQKGRLVSIGDKFQSIYGFNGSDISVFETVEAKPNTIKLTIPISYRCGTDIVEKASTVCDLIKPNPNNRKGLVRDGEWEEIRESDLVLCRFTKPLVVLFFKLLQQNIKSVVVGKDIEKGLIKLSEKVHSTSEYNIVLKLNRELTVISDELREKGFKKVKEHPKYVSMLEKVSVLKFILTMIEHPKDLTLKVKEIFDESREGVRLMTIHRSKGLENDRVFLITHFEEEKILRSKYALQTWEHIQERNLEFVAYTRAKSELVFIRL